MLNRILQSYVVLFSIISILFVIIFTVFLQLGWNIHSWAFDYSKDMYYSLKGFWIFMDSFLTYNTPVLIVLSIIFVRKEKWYGYLGLVGSIALIYKEVVWENQF